jgi:ABC-type amino acid transport substrate-binding protein
MEGRVDAFCTVATPERERYAAFSKPVLSLQYGAHHRKDLRGVAEIATLRDASRFNNVNYIGHGWALANLDRESTQWVADHQACIRMIASGRADLFVADVTVGKYFVRSLGLGETIRFTPFPFIPPVPYRIGLRRTLPDLGERIEEINGRIVKNRQRLGELYARYAGNSP